VTGRDSHRKTRANIARAVKLGIPLRTGVIHVLPQQRVNQARAELSSIGIERIGTDRMRHFGRGQGSHAACDVNELRERKWERDRPGWRERFPEGSWLRDISPAVEAWAHYRAVTNHA
jgi:hypothetical protein